MGLSLCGRSMEDRKELEGIKMSNERIQKKKGKKQEEKMKIIMKMLEMKEKITIL